MSPFIASQSLHMLERMVMKCETAVSVEGKNQQLRRHVCHRLLFSLQAHFSGA